MHFEFSTLQHPIVGAPMAGASTPELAAAISEAGGLGFIAAGYKSTDAMRSEIERTRSLTTKPFGINLFTPQRQRSAELADDLQQYAEVLAPFAARVGAEVGEPRFNDDEFEQKIEALIADPIAIVTFTFGAVAADSIARLRRAGSAVGFTVTNASEARNAERLGADFVIAQGANAGGHRGVWSVSAEPNSKNAVDVVRRIRPVTELPIVGAGGVGSGTDVRALLEAGAQAVAIGTLLVAADESSSPEAHKDALTDERYPDAAVARTFSGRYARGLANELMLAGESEAPGAYPDVHYMTAPIRKAAARRGDASLLALWAGSGHRNAVRNPAAQIFAKLVGELAQT
ncbi:NAD(P)H-dependent flavin oxidoreductase [Cumulibacter soli]|uniref:NAD(P)H-dependent flavin oxidoreductase n=1 Tax=Cumulibacter soli TaxID=2546344 RepID=UPI0010675378|nr:nitronate monooxygenase [Cumulibacter soli]